MNMKIEHKFFKDFNHEENILFHIDLSFAYLAKVKNIHNCFWYFLLESIN